MKRNSCTSTKISTPGQDTRTRTDTRQGTRQQTRTHTNNHRLPLYSHTTQTVSGALVNPEGLANVWRRYNAHTIRSLHRACAHVASARLLIRDAYARNCTNAFGRYRVSQRVAHSNVVPYQRMVRSRVQMYRLPVVAKEHRWMHFNINQPSSLKLGWSCTSFQQYLYTAQLSSCTGNTRL